VFGTLAAWGGLGAFVTMMRELLPLYASMGAATVPEILKAVQWIAPIGGLAVAAALSIAAPRAFSGKVDTALGFTRDQQSMSPKSAAADLAGFSQKMRSTPEARARFRFHQIETRSRSPRVRVMIGLTAFGLIHLLAQRKGWSYHVYPLGIGLACWGAWALAALPTWRVFACLIVIASTLGWLVPESAYRVEDNAPLRAASAMQSALESRLPRGARVQTLDADNGAFLAMARAGMRQATPHIQWFSLLLAKDSVRRDFLAALEADPPAAMLFTNAQWPKWPGFEAADDWPELMAFLTSHYDLTLTGHEDYILWRFYMRRAPGIEGANSMSRHDRRRADYHWSHEWLGSKPPEISGDSMISP
jgi:hypothetical protein